ncbi:phosphotransferase [Cryptosporangium minutisporangium]|uniref:Aminoglycoside phosphotransferase domain-containing protein n=1 Tax=Cryptosporangium minutisporangium TaxID=113569 RepID=A0ABP6TAC7_9ACTN
MTPFVPSSATASHPHPELPPALRSLLADVGVPPDALTTAGFVGPRRPVHRLLGGGLVVEVASTDAGRLRLQRELWGREWARQVGVRTVPILGADRSGGWMVAEWWRPAPPAGAAFLDDAVATALQIAGSPPPAPGPPPAHWRSPRRTAPIRLVRGLLGGVPTRLWLAARRAAATLPSVPVAHGDFYHRNALWCPERGGVHVVDWEYLGPGRKHGDLLRLWTLLPDRADRDALLHRILDLTPPDEHREVGTLALYLALRLLGENVKGSPADRHRADLEHARSIQPEARAVALALDAWPE